ncbi:MAG: hypothetical protein KDB18_12830, partial [Salinibacterium sp.]|nr:hypothetical protein [Salinibacterium sp.]
VVAAPAQSTINTGSNGAAVLVSPNPAASGIDRLVYRVTGPGGSADGVIRISYGAAWPEDRTGDLSVDIDDLYAQQQQPVDINADGAVDSEDLAMLESIVRAELPIVR